MISRCLVAIETAANDLSRANARAMLREFIRQLSELDAPPP
jgi:hypothetical protein